MYTFLYVHVSRRLRMCLILTTAVKSDNSLHFEVLSSWSMAWLLTEPSRTNPDETRAKKQLLVHMHTPYLQACASHTTSNTRINIILSITIGRTGE